MKKQKRKIHVFFTFTLSRWIIKKCFEAGKVSSRQISVFCLNYIMADLTSIIGWVDVFCEFECCFESRAQACCRGVDVTVCCPATISLNPSAIHFCTSLYVSIPIPLSSLVLIIFYFPSLTYIWISARMFN